VCVRWHVDWHAVNGGSEVGAVVEVHAPQEVVPTLEVGNVIAKLELSRSKFFIN